MTRAQIEAEIRKGEPFAIRMADGFTYPVPHPDYISISPKGSYVTVYDDNEGYSVLPMLTMTAIIAPIPSPKVAEP